MSTNTPSPNRRRTLLLTCWVPAICVMLAATGVEVARLGLPTRTQAGHTAYGTLGEAIVADDLRGVRAFIDQGQNPNALITVHDPALTGGDELMVPPIVWAAAAGRQRVVLTLLGSGVTFERAADRAASCVAEWMGFQEIAEQVRIIGGIAATAPCEPRPAGPPLRALGQAAAPLSPSAAP